MLGALRGYLRHFLGCLGLSIVFGVNGNFDSQLYNQNGQIIIRNVQLPIQFNQNNSSMSEFQCQTNATIAKRSAKRVTAKSNKISPLDEPEQLQQEITPSSFIIQTSKSIKRRKPLASAIQFFANYSCGVSLKTVTLDDESLHVDRVKRFPNSQFQICDLGDNKEIFNLVSNFLGSRYNLLQKNDVVLTISFSTGLCGNCGSRQFSIYSLAANVKYQSLTKKYMGQDLEELYEQPENKNKIQKFVTLEPKRNIDNGDLSLNFARKHVIPAVENAILVDILGQQTLQIVKLGRDVFEYSKGVGLIFGDSQLRLQMGPLMILHRLFAFQRISEELVIWLVCDVDWVKIVLPKKGLALVYIKGQFNIDNGDLSLNFATKHVIPAVENAILVDILGQQTLQIVKLGRDVFEVGFQQNIPKLWAVSLGIASLDFKWALQ